MVKRVSRSMAVATLFDTHLLHICWKMDTIFERFKNC